MSITANRYMSFPIASETPALVTVAIEHEIFLVGFIMHIHRHTSEWPRCVLLWKTREKCWRDKCPISSFPLDGAAGLSAITFLIASCIPRFLQCDAVFPHHILEQSRACFWVFPISPPLNRILFGYRSHFPMPFQLACACH